MKLLTALALLFGVVAGLRGQDKEKNSPMGDCPMMGDHAAMNARGDKGMGFSQTKTTHHFRLAADGGTIEVSVNDAADTTSRDEIGQHLGHIAMMFQKGDFQIPMFVHDKMPDGAVVMKQEKGNISYRYEPTTSGGLVRIRTTNPEALKAVHDFLRFQIREHQTGDSLEIAKDR
ncbi:MAG: hypothetical protein ACRD5Z_02655 [Bryobacteraceae bacterium]